MTKSLFIFLFLFRLTTQGSSVGKYHMIMSHDKYGKVVYRSCSSCISSIENLMGTLSNSPCQLGLGVDLSCFG